MYVPLPENVDKQASLHLRFRGMKFYQDGYECGPTQKHKFTYNLFFAHQFSLVFVYLMCGPETPKDWTPHRIKNKFSTHLEDYIALNISCNCHYFAIHKRENLHLVTILIFISVVFN